MLNSLGEADDGLRRYVQVSRHRNRFRDACAQKLESGGRVGVEVLGVKSGDAGVPNEP